MLPVALYTAIPAENPAAHAAAGLLICFLTVRYSGNECEMDNQPIPVPSVQFPPCFQFYNKWKYKSLSLEKNFVI